MQKEEEIVTFETYYDPMLAQIIRTKLEANGIHCFVTDESLGVLYPVYNQGGGGIKLKVFAHDVEKCKTILADEPGLLPGEELEGEK
ncbi:MAG: putative signal transducing protein [Mucilaginibacter sp.]